MRVCFVSQRPALVTGHACHSEVFEHARRLSPGMPRVARAGAQVRPRHARRLMNKKKAPVVGTGAFKDEFWGEFG